MICSILHVCLYTSNHQTSIFIIILNRANRNTLQFTHAYHSNTYVAIQQELITFTHLFFWTLELLSAHNKSVSFAYLIFIYYVNCCKMVGKQDKIGFVENFPIYVGHFEIKVTPKWWCFCKNTVCIICSHSVQCTSQWCQQDPMTTRSEFI